MYEGRLARDAGVIILLGVDGPHGLNPASFTA
jgi:hypothetical protein